MASAPPPAIEKRSTVTAVSSVVVPVADSVPVVDTDNLAYITRINLDVNDPAHRITLLTTEPSPDVAPIHDRQMVVLERSDWSAWLEQTGNEGDLLKALPAGSLRVEQVR